MNTHQAYLIQYVQYIANTKQEPLSVAAFDDDWEPIGPQLSFTETAFARGRPMTDHAALIERLEKATGPDRKLDRDLGFALDGWTWFDAPGIPSPMIRVGERGTDLYPDHPGSEYPSFTESLDAATALVERVLPGTAIQNLSWWPRVAEPAKDDPRAQVVLLPTNAEGWGDSKRRSEGNADTPALAILIALLKSLNKDRAIKEDGNG